MNKIPGPSESFWQQFQLIRRDFLGFLVDAGRTYGDLVRLQPGPGAALHLVNHPDLIYDVLVGRQRIFHRTKTAHRVVGKFLGNGLVLNEGHFHRQQRRLIQPAFHRKRVVAYADTMNTLTQHQIDSWDKDAVVDFEAEMTELTLRIVAKTLFNVRIDEGKNEEIGESMMVFGEAMSTQYRSLPLPDWLPTQKHRAQKRAIATMDAKIYQMIAERRASGEDKGDLLSMLLLAQDEETGTQMDDKQLRDEAVTLYFAGHETTAKLLTWVIFLLAQHREVEAQLRDEVDRVVNGRFPTIADLPQLTYLDQVIKETLRLYPPAWVFDRMPVEDIELGGYQLKKGAMMYISSFVFAS